MDRGKYMLQWKACHKQQTLLIGGKEEHPGDDYFSKVKDIANKVMIKDQTKESFIHRDRKVEKKVGAIFHPSVTMNGKTFRGDYNDPNQMFKAICSFIGKNKPEICRKLNFKNGKSQDERDNQEK